MNKREDFDEIAIEKSNHENETVGQRIRRLRLEHGDKLSFLAYLLGYASPSSITKIESGVNSLPAVAAKRLALYWQLPLDYILCQSSYESAAEEDRAELERRFRSSISDDMKDFLTSLGLPLPGVGFVPRFIDRETGVSMDFTEAGKVVKTETTDKTTWKAVGELVDDQRVKIRRGGFYYSVALGKKTYQIPADEFEKMLRIVMDSARSSFEIACRTLGKGK